MQIYSHATNTYKARAWMNVTKYGSTRRRLALIQACRFVGEEHQQRRVRSTYLNTNEGEHRPFKSIFFLFIPLRQTLYTTPCNARKPQVPPPLLVFFTNNRTNVKTCLRPIHTRIYSHANNSYKARAWMNVTKYGSTRCSLALFQGCRFVGEEHQQRRVRTIYLTTNEVENRPFKSTFFCLYHCVKPYTRRHLTHGSLKFLRPCWCSSPTSART